MPDPASPQGAIIAPHPRIAARLIGGRALILDPRVDELQRLNDVGSFIWARIAERRFDRDGLLAAVLEAFEVDRATAAADLDGLLSEMRARSLIAERGPEPPEPAR